MPSPRMPIRLLEVANISSAYPRELVADFSTGNLTLVTPSGGSISIPNGLTLTTSGSGNAVTAVSVSGHSITITKGATYLTAHPGITMGTNTTSSTAPGFGGSFTAIDSVTKDSYGHVTNVNTKTVSLPASPTASSLGCAVTYLYTASIGTSWSGSAAPYTQSIYLSGIVANDTPIVDINFASVTYANKASVVEAFGKVYRIVTTANYLTVYADEKTTIAVPIQLKVVR